MFLFSSAPFFCANPIETRFRAVRVELTGRRAGNDRTLSGKNGRPKLGAGETAGAGGARQRLRPGVLYGENARSRPRPVSHAPARPAAPSTWTPMLTRRSRSHPQTVREKCFAKCITKPGPSLSSGEATCVSRCTDRYVDATRMISGVVLQAYSSGQGGVQ